MSVSSIRTRNAVERRITVVLSQKHTKIDRSPLVACPHPRSRRLRSGDKASEGSVLIPMLSLQDTDTKFLRTFFSVSSARPVFILDFSPQFRLVFYVGINICLRVFLEPRDGIVERVEKQTDEFLRRIFVLLVYTIGYLMVIALSKLSVQIAFSI